MKKHRLRRLLLRLGAIAISALILVFLCGLIGDLGFFLAIWIAIEIWGVADC